MDIETAKRIRHGIDWPEILKELDLMVEADLARLKTCGPDKLESIQERIKTIEEIKSLPQNVIDREEE